jgi:hypothetical protein
MSEVIQASDALKVTRRLQEELKHDIHFAQALVNSATLEDLNTLKRVTMASANLRSNVMTAPLRRQYQNIKEIDRNLRRKTKLAIRRDVER